jgi:hypothetical protein
MKPVLIAIAVIAGSAGPAVADTPALDPANRDAATKLVADGSAKLEHQDFTGALEMYREAYRIYPSPKLHFNLALALQGLHRDVEAADELDRFIGGAPDAPPDTVAQATKMLVELDRTIAKLVVVTNIDTATISIDDQDAGTLPVTRRLAPGSHKLHATAPGKKPWDETVMLTAGVTTRKTVLLEIDLQVKTVPDKDRQLPPPVTPKHEGGSILGKWWFWTAVGVVAAGSGVIAYEATKQPGAPASELGTFTPNL